MNLSVQNLFEKKKNQRCSSEHSFLVTTVQISQILTTGPFTQKYRPWTIVSRTEILVLHNSLNQSWGAFELPANFGFSYQAANKINL